MANISAKGLIHDLQSIGDGTAASDPKFVIGALDRAAKFNFPARTIRELPRCNIIQRCTDERQS